MRFHTGVVIASAGKRDRDPVFIMPNSRLNSRKGVVSCIIIAEQRGDLVPQDMGEALVWMSRAAHAGSPLAQAWMGDVLDAGLGVVADPESALGWYALAADRGHIGALAKVTQAAMGAGVDERRRADVLALWRVHAEGGSALAQRMVGDFLVRGFGATPDLKEAAVWLGRAADQGNAAAQTMLAGLMLQGRLTPSDPELPVRLLRAAAEQGSADAQYNLAILSKHASPPDLAGARIWFEKAAAQGGISGQLGLADLILETTPPGGTITEALVLYNQASEAGSAHAAFAMGRLLERGVHVDRNLEYARGWYELAAERGLAEAEAALLRLNGDTGTGR